jgi:hypothetical protein
VILWSAHRFGLNQSAGARPDNSRIFMALVGLSPIRKVLLGTQWKNAAPPLRL